MRKKRRGYDLFMPEEINSTAVEETRALVSSKRFFGVKRPCVRGGEPLAITRLADVRDGSFGTFVHVEGEDGNEYGVKYFKSSHNKSMADIEAGVKKEYDRLVALGGLGGGVVRAYARGHVMTASGRGEKTYPAILMDIAGGFPLADVVADSLLSGSVGELPGAERVARAGLPVASTYSRLHVAGMTHRDGSPTNVFLNIGEHEDRAILIDFGNSFAADETLTTATKGRLATAYFGAPEVFMDGEDAGAIRHQPAQDVWTLGALLYYMRTGAYPHENLVGSLSGEDREYRAALVRIKRENPILLEEGLDAARRQRLGNNEFSDMDERLNYLIMRCTNFDPDKRPSMEETVDELKLVAIGLGELTEQDYKEIANFYRLAAEQGNVYAQNSLGLCYDQGRGVEQDYEEAVRLYRLAVEQGYAAAQNNLGLCCERGEGVEQDYAEAVKFYRMAADQGCAAAQNNLGACYAQGQGVEQDFVEAVKFYRMAADQGYARAQNNLGACYAQGRGVEQDYEEAVRLFRLAADQGYAYAQCNLGNCYYHGRGVVRDRVEAVKLYRLAAAQGDASAQNSLGLCYEQGRGVEQDYEEAVKFYRLAAEQGNAGAQNNLGACYAQGRGVEQDYEEAVRLFRLAVEQGNAYAQNNLGNCYYHGWGVVRDYEEAARFFRLAVDQGYSHAKEMWFRCYEAAGKPRNWQKLKS